MPQQVEAIYENGVLRPLEPLNLANAQRVRITVTPTDPGCAKRDLKLLERVKAEVAGMTERPSLEDVQRMLAAIPGSLKEDIAVEREDR